MSTYCIDCIKCKEAFELPEDITHYWYPKYVQCPNCSGYLEIRAEFTIKQRRIRMSKGLLKLALEAQNDN